MLHVSIRRVTRPFRLRRVKWKIMLPFLLLTALFALFATQNVTQLVTSSLEDRLQRQLVAASQHASDTMAKRERDHLELLRSVANTQGVAEAVPKADRAQLERLILPAAANANAEYVEVFDAGGFSVYGVQSAAEASSRKGLPGRQAPQDWASVRSVLAGQWDASGDKFVQLVTTPSGPMLLTVGPVRGQDGKLEGAVVIGSPLHGMLLEVKRNAFADVTLSGANGSLVSSTFDPADASEENGFLRGEGTAAGEGASASGEVLGREYHFLGADLTLRGETLGTLTVALPVDSVTDAGQATRLRMSLIFGVIALAVVVIGWAVARQLTTPLTRLVSAAVAVSSGDLSARSNVRTSDEIGVLGASFDAMAEQLEQQHIATIGALASAIDARDPYTSGHSVRVGDLSAEIGTDMGMARPAIHHLRVGGLLHDIGKIGIRDTILLKPGALTPEERRIIEQHPTIGLRILESARLPREVLEIVGGHHERLNGKGYPLGLSSDELTVFPRVTAVADMYDALTTDRPYRPGLSPQEALRILWRDAEAGLLDNEVVATMRRIAQVWEERRRSEAVQTQDWLASLQAIREFGFEAA